MAGKQVLLYLVVCALCIFAQEDALDHGHISTTTVATGQIPFIEQRVIGPFKLWHVAGLALCGCAALLIAICCFLDIRVPRTKEEIEANYEKRQAAHKYIDKLGRLDFSGLQLKSQALLQKDREKKKKELQEAKEKRKAEKKLGVKATGTNNTGDNTCQQQQAFYPGMMPGMMPGMQPQMGMMGQMAGQQVMPNVQGMMIGNPMMMGNPMMWQQNMAMANQQASMSRNNSESNLEKTDESSKGTPRFKRTVMAVMEKQKEDEEDKEAKEQENKPAKKKKWSKQ